MQRRTALAYLIGLCLAASGASEALAAESDATSPGGVDLKTALEKGLRARRPDEFEFIADVVGRVDDGTLPRSVVESTFLWARKKPATRAFQYFRQGLKVRSKRLGVTL